MKLQRRHVAVPATPRSCDTSKRGTIEIRLARLIAVLCFAIAATSLDAQTGPQGMLLSAISDCIKDAVGLRSVEVGDEAAAFSCEGAKAKILYNFLGNKIRSEVVLDRNGKFENRAFGNNACYHRVEDENGKRADEFRCDLIMTIGDALTK
jgi:hypothetical protein